MNKKYQTKIVGILAILVFSAAILLVYVLSIKKELQFQLDSVNEVHGKLEIQQQEIQIYLPEICYAAVGVPFEIYNSQITDCGNDISRYNVRWNCSIGENLERKYSLTVTEEMVGEHELTVSVYDNALNLLVEKTCKLKVVDGKNFEEIAIHQLKNSDDFLEEDFAEDAVAIYLQANNVKDAEENSKRVVETIEKLRSTDPTIQIYVANAFFKGIPDYETFHVMTDLEEKLKDYENVYLVPVGIGVDCVYNYDILTGMLNEAGEAQATDLFTAVICGTIN